MQTVIPRLIAAFLALAVVAVPARVWAQSNGQPGATQQSSTETKIDLPVDLGKIQKAISRPPAIQTKSDRPVFRVEIFAKKPTIEDILGPDYPNGPGPYSGMTRQGGSHNGTPGEY